MKEEKLKTASGQRLDRRDNRGKQKGRRKKRRINRLRVTVFLFAVILAIAGVVILFMMKSPYFKPDSENSNGKSQAVFGVKSIIVTGNSHYTEEQITQTSGIYTGQSVFSVNKKKAAENILQSFPYIEKVTIDSPAFNKIKISIVEEQPVGVLKMDTGWMILGQKGKGLETLPDDSERLSGQLRIIGSLLPDAGVGSMMLDDRSLSIMDRLFAAFDSYGLQDVTEINLEDYTNIQLKWKDQITILLGNDTNLDHEISMVITTLNRVQPSDGTTAKGRLDLSTYSDSDSNNDWAVFTPEDVLTKKTE